MTKNSPPRLLFATGALLLSVALPSPRATQAMSAMAGMDTDEPDTFVSATNSLVGKLLADWGDLHFVDGPEHRSPGDFRDRVVIVRFWTIGCPRCRASAATLAEWKRRDPDDLEVIAILLPKKGTAVSDESARQAAADMGWNATVAVDPDWSALERVWDHSGPRYAVSVGLLVDRDGIVRAVHHGGTLSETDPRGRPETIPFRKALQQVLSEHRI